MKKTSILILALIACIFFSGFALADSQILLFVNGKQIDPPVPPQIIDGTTMVPVRSVAESLDCDVNWHDGIVEVNSKTTSKAPGISPTANTERPVINCPDDMKATIQKALDVVKEKDPPSYQYIIAYVDEITYVDSVLLSKNVMAFSKRDTRIVTINKKSYDELKSLYAESELAQIYLGTLAHEATHKYLDKSEFRGTDYEEVICESVNLKVMSNVTGKDNKVFKLTQGILLDRF